ncbi:hypothetical protein ACWD0A_05770 [Streptomyces sp. NPDC002867]
MTCGKERPAETAPPAPVPVPAHVPVPAQTPAPVPPPPAYGPGPAAPSPVAAFFRRALRGDWAASVRAALWPTGLLLLLATALAIPSYGQQDEVVVGWSDRLRIALALLMQGFGGGFKLKAADGTGFGTGDSSDGGRFGWGDSSGGYGDGSGGSGFSDSGMEAVTQGTASLSLVPLTVTVLWIAALWTGARMLRARGAGLEAAVRVSLVVTAAVLVLGLFAQPGIAGIEVSASPLLAALGALVLSAVVTAGVLQRDDLAAWLAQRPAARSAVRAFGTAVRALAVVVALCSLTGFAVYAANDDVDGTALLMALPLLPNIGLTVLGLGWGVPVTYDVRGDAVFFGWGSEHGSFGLGEISDVWGRGAVAGAVALGAVSALIIGVWAARRSADRREQLLAAAFVLGLVLLFTGVCGVSAEMAGGLAGFGGQGFAEIAPSVPDALLFGLMWVGGATFVGSLLPGRPGQWPAAQATPYTPPPVPYGSGAAPAPAPYAPGPPAPGAPAPGQQAGGPEAPAAGAAGGGPHDPYTVHLGAPAMSGTAPPAAGPGGGATGDRRRKVLLWTATLTAAFVIGGGATAGLLIWQDQQDTDHAPTTQDRRSAPPAQTPDAKPQATPSPAASPSSSASPSPPASPGGTLPAGFVVREDPAGFSVAVMEGWTRRQAGSQVFYEAPTGGEYLQIGVIRNTPMSSYENFTGLEKKHLANAASDYRRLRLEQNTYQGRPGALWEFTHIPEPDEGGLVRHVIDQAFVAADGTEYAILAAGRADRWDPDKDVVFSTAVATFTAG